MEAKTLNRTSWKTCTMPSSKNLPVVSLYVDSYLELFGP